MATVRIITAMTIDGFLPDADNPRMRWLMTDAKGVSIWPEIAGTGTHIFQNGVPSGWILSKSTRLKNGICRNIYRRKAR